MVTQAPMSQNVTTGQSVVFTCETTDTNPNITISWLTEPDITQNPTGTLNLPGGGKYSNLQITASGDVTDVNITCVIIDTSTGMSDTSQKARLLVQGVHQNSIIYV